MSVWTRDLGERVCLVLNALKGLGNVLKGSHRRGNVRVLQLPKCAGGWDTSANDTDSHIFKPPPIPV